MGALRKAVHRSDRLVLAAAEHDEEAKPVPVAEPKRRVVAKRRAEKPRSRPPAGERRRLVARLRVGRISYARNAAGEGVALRSRGVDRKRHVPGNRRGRNCGKKGNGKTLHHLASFLTGKTTVATVFPGISTTFSSPSYSSCHAKRGSPGIWLTQTSSFLQR